MKRIAIASMLFVAVMLQACVPDKDEGQSVSKVDRDVMISGALGGGCDHVRTIQEIREKKSCKR